MAMKLVTKYKKYAKELWSHACRYQKLSEAFIRKHENEVDWVQVSFHQKLSIKFAEEFKDKLAWDAVCRNIHINEKFIKHFFNREDIIHRYIKGNSPETDKTRMGRGAAMQQMWFDITKHHKLSENFIREFQKQVDWNIINSNYDYLSFDFIREFEDKLVFKNFARIYKFTEKQIEELSDEIDWIAVCECQNMNEQFIIKNSEKLYLDVLLEKSRNYKRKKKIKLSDEFINNLENIFPDVDYALLNNMFVNGYKMNNKQLNNYVKGHKGDVNWDLISRSQELSEKFIDKYADKLNWDNISAWQKLTPYLMDKYENKINWEQIGMNCAIDNKVFVQYKNKFKTTIGDFVSSYRQLTEDIIEELDLSKDAWTKVCEYQTLSENFIRRHADKVDWESIISYQKLSEDFIREFKDKIRWETIGAFQHLSEELIWEMRNKMNLNYAFSQIQHLSEPFMEKLIHEYE